MTWLRSGFGLLSKVVLDGGQSGHKEGDGHKEHDEDEEVEVRTAQQNVRGNICGGLGCWYGLSAVTRYAICTRVPILFSPGQGADAMDNGAE